MKHGRHSRRAGKRRNLSRKSLLTLRRWKHKHRRQREKALRRAVARRQIGERKMWERKMWERKITDG